MAFLIAERLITANGHTDALPLSELAATGEVPGRLQVTLGVMAAEEQQSIEVLVEHSSDGATWDPKPLAAFPQKFGVGTWALVPAMPEGGFLRARWLVNRWGRGSLVPEFKVYLFGARPADGSNS